ncbi:hypothetical protein GCM10010472_01570 [Pseudonocardia halophobica]|uniref:DUF4440 domain-containing protein n=1 Tax=Pseudonocardia halophobica TaxID=29401 RepID=A0A9W6NVK3_9PSEU|nr:nuclear transport factor 2 family protein [Pseudonocardia halophobica]GLL10497.1 hypothetical protein GCM10017577_16370 [Pseudonocardia halophobica]
MSTDKDEAMILELERQRFDAVVDQDFELFASTAHPALMYTHSNGVTDTLESYLEKCRNGFYVYHRIDHPVTKIVIEGDTAVVLGEMNADLTAGGTRKQLANTSLAVWVRDGESWKLLAYQPTPRA